MLRQDQVRVHIWNTDLLGGLSGRRTRFGHATLEYYDYKTDSPTRVLINFLPRINQTFLGITKTGGLYDDTQDVEMRDPEAIEKFFILNPPSEMYVLNNVDVNRIQLHLSILSLDKQQWSIIGGSAAASVIQSTIQGVKRMFFGPNTAEEKISSTSLILSLLNSGGVTLNLTTDRNKDITVATIALGLVWAAAAAELGTTVISATAAKAIVILVMSRINENLVNGETLADELSQELSKALSPVLGGVKALFFVTPEQLGKLVNNAEINQFLVNPATTTIAPSPGH